MGSFSWLRVGVAVVGLIVGFALTWKLTPLPRWVERTLRPQPVAAGPTGGEFDAKLWEEALRHWEPFVFEASDASRVVALGIATYVPRDNLANIEGRVSGRRPNRSEIIDALPQLDRVLLRYPERVLRAAGFERIVWLCEIVKDGAPAWGFAMPPVKALVLDPNAFEPSMFHHELFHMVDYRLHGYPGAQPAWDALNRGAPYTGLEAYAAQLGKPAGLVPPHCVSAYACAAANEDRAETFRVLMSEPALSAARRAASPVIEAKAQYILAQLDALAGGSSVSLGLR